MAGLLVPGHMILATTKPIKSIITHTYQNKLHPLLSVLHIVVFDVATHYRTHTFLINSIHYSN